MTYDEIWNEFKNLSPEQRGKFLDAARNLQKFNNSYLRAGTKVSFTTRHGVRITGIYVRMKQKYAEVESNFDRYGRDVGQIVRWSVTPESLRLEQ